MAALSPPVCDFGWQAPGFTLPDATGKLFSLDDLKGPKGTLVMFICNHCPFVQAIADRIARDTAELTAHGINSVAVMSNDIVTHPADAPDKMATFAAAHGFAFPYLYDATQDVARAYDAVCTPDFFGLNAQGQLQYRGRFDSAGRGAGDAQTTRELFDAMVQIARTGAGPREQTASIGCSIKWKAA